MSGCRTNIEYFITISSLKLNIRKKYAKDNGIPKFEDLFPIPTKIPTFDTIQ